jgi:hypothetical protein
MSVGAGLLFFNALLASCLSAYYASLNARLDKRHGPSRLARGVRRTGLPWKSREVGRAAAADGDEYLKDTIDVELMEELAAGVNSPHFRYVA